MDIRTVKLKGRSYNIVIASGQIAMLGAYVKKTIPRAYAYIITNAFLRKNYGKAVVASLSGSGIKAEFALIADTEKSKSLGVADRLINKLAKFDTHRGAFVIALGGGVVGDVAGFVASIYKRGIPYVQIPTTLLAQVDSAIGGKTGIDLSAGKNLAGTFYQPALVFCDISFLRTLDTRQLRSGLAEVIKYAVIKDPQLFYYLEKEYQKLLVRDEPALRFAVKRCSGIKARIVELDEKETKGIRTILNFGHTIGHAVEAATGYRQYSHGEAIALGMLVASAISQSLGFISSSTENRIKGLVTKAGLPSRIKGATLNAILAAHYHDKKFSGAKNKFVLIKGIGNPVIQEEVPLTVVKKAVKKYLGA